MEKELKLNKRRDFGACIEDAFIFLRRNFKPIMRCFLYYAAPIFLVGTLLGIFAIRTWINPLIESGSIPAAANVSMLVLYLCLMIAYFIVYAMAFAAISAYHQKGNQNITSGDITEHLWTYTGKLFVFFLLSMLAIFTLFGIAGGLMFITPFFGLLFLPLMVVFMYYSLPMQMTPYIIVHEKLGYVESFLRAVKLIKHNWWNTFALLFVVGLIGGMAAYALAMPAYIMMFVDGFSSMDPEAMMNANTGFWGILALVLYFLGAMLASIFTNTSLVMKYYDLVAQKDSSHWDERIDQIGKRKDSMFDNEGEY